MTAPVISAWGLNNLIEYVRASHIAVESDAAGAALLDLEGDLWGRLLDLPIKRPADATAKLDALLSDLTRRDEIDPAGQRILGDVIRWLRRVDQ